MEQAPEEEGKVGLQLLLLLVADLSVRLLCYDLLLPTQAQGARQRCSEDARSQVPQVGADIDFCLVCLGPQCACLANILICVCPVPHDFCICHVLCSMEYTHPACVNFLEA